MIYIRSILYAIFGLLSMVIYGILCLLSCLIPIGFKRRYRFMVVWPRMMIWGAKWIVGINYVIKGREHIPDEPVIVCSKHQSMYETLFFPWFMPNPVCYVHKKVLNQIPIFGWAFSRLKHIPIDRSKPTEAIRQLVEIGAERVKEHRDPVIFPEGTRVAPGEKGRYQQGAARMALASGANILPVALNAGLCWKKKAVILKPGTITISFGPVIQTAGRNHQEIMKEVEDWIEQEQKVLNPELYE
ncbi:acyl-phosphate glycerol 3-phosphate acyltransferase [Basilea psittacipulmonis DSM 24701]|uniref:Acyl-phosphate glycerol 3-phosphate acyltransferase n=1 Tax=Basilea psittacipulmonis DSM 24701 TaxID=1072685 RepID=A0A077DFP1_9BURK|nr:acyl-phosphate glycerol 3-phosphate acyltransferase [Basilea psittacipulmonis DSM 24701]